MPEPTVVPAPPAIGDSVPSTVVQPTVASPPEPTVVPTSTTTPGNAPQFDGPFDADRASKLIENLRGEIKDLKGKVKEPAKPEPEKDEDPRYTALMERLEAAENRDKERAATELRSKVAENTGVPIALLSGDNEDALKTHAEALIKWADERANTPALRRPRAQLVPGAGTVASDGGVFDPAKIAAAAHR